MSHGLLTKDASNKVIDILAQQGMQPNQKAAVDALLSRDQTYIKRQRPNKLDLDLTLLQVLDSQRGGGSQVRVKE